MSIVKDRPVAVISDNTVKPNTRITHLVKSSFLGGLCRSTQEINLEDPFGGILAAVGFAMRATVHTTTQATPSQLVFNRDAIHNVK